VRELITSRAELSGQRGGSPSLSKPLKREKLLMVLFLLTVPLSNPWVRGDGVGYYAFARALLIERGLDFENDWKHGNESFTMSRLDAHGNVLPTQYTSTGHLDNHFSIGPAILWLPFLLVAHLAVHINHILGGRIPADGFSFPYILAMCLGTACYGFGGLWLSFLLARKYFSERSAFWGTVGIWFASSLPVYMYFNPSWSHAHSAFAVALFLWYWDKSRGDRSWTQWLILGVIAGLMMNTYYLNTVLLLVPLMESIVAFSTQFRSKHNASVLRLFGQNAVFALTLAAAFLPTLVAKKILYGSYWNLGYTERWFPNSPALLKVCFSSEHGLFSWTPITVVAVAGLLFLRRRDSLLGYTFIAVFAVYVYVLGCYQDWAGISSFGSRFFVSLTPIFVVGLAAFFERLASAWQERRTAIVTTVGVSLLIIWNLGLVFQWGVHLIPARGPISWRDAFHNQFVVVPDLVRRDLTHYITRRRELMENIEKDDVQHGGSALQRGGHTN
jgi:Dolichyl-phosphate-mannose-protein mannosyltransferase